MLKRLLSFLVKLKIKKPQPPQSQEAVSSPKPSPHPGQSPSLTQNLSPNLLTTAELKNISQISLNDSFYVRLMLLIQVLFVIVLAINYFLNQRIEGLKTDISDLTVKINSYNNVDKTISDLSAKLERYRTINSQRFLLEKKIRLLLSGASGIVDLQDVSVSKTSSTISARASSPLSFSTLLVNYFKDKGVQAVILRSADLNASDGTFSMVFDVVFK